MTLIQALQDGDFIRREKFCNWARYRDRILHRRVLFSVECTHLRVTQWSILGGITDTVQSKILIGLEKCIVNMFGKSMFCVVKINDKIIRPIFKGENLNDARYETLLEDLQEWLDELLLQC